jgi:hypothetical protein
MVKDRLARELHFMNDWIAYDVLPRLTTSYTKGTLWLHAQHVTDQNQFAAQSVTVQAK